MNNKTIRIDDKVDDKLDDKVDDKIEIIDYYNPDNEIKMRRDKAIKFYKLAKCMADIFSKDDSTKVGAILLRSNTLEILTMGYNGMPRGINENITARWQRPLKYKLVEHAERNAIYNGARSGTSLQGSICVVTLFPCSDCARGLIQSGVKMIVSLNLNDIGDTERLKRWKTEWDESLWMLKEAGINILFLNLDEIDYSLS